MTLTLDLEGDAVERLELLVRRARTGSPSSRARRGWCCGSPRSRSEEVELRLRCSRWGAYLLGGVRIRAHDRFGVLLHEERLEPSLPLKVYPHAETLRALLRPQETQVSAGNQVARVRGEGIEFADLRPFTPGDRPRRINWRASARRGALWVNEAHPERNADVVLFLDTFAEARRAGPGTLDLAVGAAGSLAERYLLPQGPGRARQLRRRAQLAAARPPGSSSSTASWTRCSTRRSSSTTRGRTST